jgi:hypothetical protein
VGLAFALVAIAAVLTWAHLAIAALTVCLNETPVLADGIRDWFPASDALARWLLPFVAPLGVSAGSPLGVNAGTAPVCDPAAPARAMAVAGLAYAAGIAVLDFGGLPRRLTWPLVIGVAAIVRAALLFMPGLLSSDIIDYATHGRVASLHAANPYLQTPAQFPADPYANLGAWPTTVTVYGPLWTRVDAAVTGLLPAASLAEITFAYKLIALAADVVTVMLIVWLARRWHRLGATSVAPVAAAAMWLWNPLVNLELVGNAHNEALMLALVLFGLALLTLALTRSARSSTATPLPPPSSITWTPSQEASHVTSQDWLWVGALLVLWLGTLIKFVPLAIGAIAALVWLRRTSRRVAPAAALVAGALLVTLVVAAPWLDSPAVAAPLVGLANGGQRFKDVWQDAPAAWLTVRVVPLFGVPDDPATLRMDVARIMVWSVTRALFVIYLVLEIWQLWRRARGPADVVLRGIATASIRVLLLALLLYTSQVYAWYFLWPLPIACLLGSRNGWSRAVIVFGLTFLPAFYLREFAPYGVFEMPRYAELALAILAVMWLAARLVSRQPLGRLMVRQVGSTPGASERSEAVHL